MATPSTGKRQFLNLKQNLALSKYVADVYPTQDKSDGEFAQLATRALGFDVTVAHVTASRIAQDIPSTAARLKEARRKAEEAQRAAGVLPPSNPAGHVYARLRELEARVENLTIMVNTLHAKLAPLLN